MNQRPFRGYRHLVWLSGPDVSKTLWSPFWDNSPTPGGDILVDVVDSLPAYLVYTLSHFGLTRVTFEEGFEVVQFVWCRLMYKTIYNLMKLGNVPPKLKKNLVSKLDIFRSVSPFSRVQFILFINCTLENALTVRNISSFYNKFFKVIVSMFHQVPSTTSLSIIIKQPVCIEQHYDNPG
jgi:hypothetical protein